MVGSSFLFQTLVQIFLLGEDMERLLHQNVHLVENSQESEIVGKYTNLQIDNERTLLVYLPYFLQVQLK